MGTTDISTETDPLGIAEVLQPRIGGEIELLQPDLTAETVDLAEVILAERGVLQIIDGERWHVTELSSKYMLDSDTTVYVRLGRKTTRRGKPIDDDIHLLFDPTEAFDDPLRADLAVARLQTDDEGQPEVVIVEDDEFDVPEVSDGQDIEVIARIVNDIKDKYKTADEQKQQADEQRRIEKSRTRTRRRRAARSIGGGVTKATVALVLIGAIGFGAYEGATRGFTSQAEKAELYDDDLPDIDDSVPVIAVGEDGHPSRTEQASSDALTIERVPELVITGDGDDSENTGAFGGESGSLGGNSEDDPASLTSIRAVDLNLKNEDELFGDGWYDDKTETYYVQLDPDRNYGVRAITADEHPEDITVKVRSDRVSITFNAPDGREDRRPIVYLQRVPIAGQR